MKTQDTHAAKETAPAPADPKEGEILLGGLQEDGRGVEFDPPLQVNWWVIAEESSEERTIIDILLDNGINWKAGFSKSNPHPAGNREGEEKLETSIKRMLAFEFIHSFFHYEGDPNYTLLNWAISGHFKERAKKTGEEA